MNAFERTFVVDLARRRTFGFLLVFLVLGLFACVACGGPRSTAGDEGAAMAAAEEESGSEAVREGQPPAEPNEADSSRDEPSSTERASRAEEPDEPEPQVERPADWTPSMERLIRVELAGSQDEEELMRRLSGLRSRLDEHAHVLERGEMHHWEREIVSVVESWVVSHGAPTGIARGEACLANSQCSSGGCAGRGCIPGSWRCEERPGRDQPQTTDMARACLCSGSSYEGSSSALSGTRVRSWGSECEDTGTWMDFRRSR